MPEINKAIILLRRLSSSIIPVLAMMCFMFISMWLLSAATENSGQFGRMHVALVVINVLGLIILLTLISMNIIRLVRQYQTETIGSRLTTKLVAVFAIMALVPVGIVYYFSLGFLQRGIDSWFDVRIERAMEDSIKLSRSSLDMRMRDMLKQTHNMAESLINTSDELAVFALNDLRDNSGASELTLITQSGHVIASSSANPTAIIPQMPGDIVLSQIRKGEDYVGLTPVDELGMHIRAAVNVEETELVEPVAEPRLLFALFPLDERIGVLAGSVQSAFSKYKELVYLRDPLKQSFVITLSLVVLVTLLSAVWVAFFFAQRLVAPIRVLSIGTRALAAGNYQKKLPTTSSDDELGNLVELFADMTDKIAAAQDEAQQSQQQAEQERSYLSAVLGHLSSGVITLDQNHALRTVNAAALQILGSGVEKAIGSNLKVLEKQVPELQAFVHALVLHVDNLDDEWREEVTLFTTSGRKTLMCQGSRLPLGQDMQAGFVVVFDDVTSLIQVQRDAAWGEVARRLAHEIRNPLTPIQLSAERLRHKYLQQMSPEDAEILDRSTHTIVQQVEALKEMVQAFSEYARAPKLQLQPLSLQSMVDEVLDLYRSDDQSLQIAFDASDKVPAVEADPGRLRQLLHNLIRNAIESLSGQKDKQLQLHLHSVDFSGKDYVELQVVDNGPGIPRNMLDKLFEPYITTKPKGSGLGLAVVKRIVEEHSGMIYAKNNDEGGACIVVRLPALEHDISSAGVSKIQKLGNR